jgi:hypothetical protein
MEFMHVLVVQCHERSGAADTTVEASLITSKLESETASQYTSA